MTTDGPFPDADQARRQLLKERLGRLLSAHAPRPRPEEIAAALATRGVQVNPEYLRSLINGTRPKTNPTLEILQGLADYFGVTVGELVDPVEAVEATSLNRILLRASGELSPRGRKAVEDMIQTVIQLEQAQRAETRGDEQ